MADNDNKPEQVSSPRGEERKHKDKKKDKPKHSASSSNVTEKPVTPRAAENKETKETKEPINTPAKETRTNRGPTEDVTEFLNDPKLQTGLKHKLVRKGTHIFYLIYLTQIIKLIQLINIKILPLKTAMNSDYFLTFQ